METELKMNKKTKKQPPTSEQTLNNLQTHWESAEVHHIKMHKSDAFQIHNQINKWPMAEVLRQI